MGCFTLGFLQQLFIWLIVVCAVIAIIRVLVPLVTGLVGFPVIGQILNIFLWAVVAIFCVYIAFALIGCLIGSGGSLPHFPR